MNDYRQYRIQQNLRLRAAVMSSIRNFFNNNDYLEVETPIHISAPAPERHIDPVPSGPGCLQTSPELCMKRLLSAGYSRIFQICKCFRANERGPKHLSEFTMLEWYCTGTGYRDFMGQCEKLIQAVAADLELANELTYQKNTIDLLSPWHRISVPEAFARWSTVSMDEALSTERFDEIMVTDIEPNLGIEKPTFLYDYPAACAALAKLNPNNPTLAQRFELYISGIELCNAFMELTDPREQRRRFDEERSAMRRMGKHLYPMPEMFLRTLSQMPAAAGNALGVDRLVMLFADTEVIDDVVAFTTEEI